MSVQPPPFEVISGLAHTSHGAMALAVAAEFDDVVDVEAVEGALMGLAERLRPVADAPDDQQLALAGDVLARSLRSCGSRSATTLDDLLFHRVASSGRGQGIACALVAVEAARLAGVDFGVVASRAGVYIGHPRAVSPLLLVPGRGWLPVDARTLDDPALAWHCPHESAGLVLGMILARGRRTGQLGMQLRAAEMCLALPVEDDERERLRMQLACVRARLN